MNQNNVRHTIPNGVKNKKAFEDLSNFLDTGNYRYIRTPIKAEIKTDRNDSCPCGSGKKYKNCCMNK